MADYPSKEGPLDAGDFSGWMDEVQGALHGKGIATVPCGGCTACCTSSQFVHIAADEKATLEHIPQDLLVPAPRSKDGSVVLGFDERGRCPMLAERGCSIYEYRPKTCRTYDCRIIAASGLRIDDPAKSALARQIMRWRFSFDGDDAAITQEAVRAAARFIVEHRDELPHGLAPLNPTGVAVLAIEAHRAFVRAGGSDVAVCEEPDLEAVLAELTRVDVEQR